jgi:polyhydroxybutyrate depolymerase
MFKTRISRTALFVFALVLAAIATYRLRPRLGAGAVVQIEARGAAAEVLPQVDYPGPQHPLLLERGRLQVGSKTRTYDLRIPQASAKPWALVFVVHGDGGDGGGFHRGFPYEQASGEDAVLVYPDGEHATWDLETPIATNTDYAFFRALAAELTMRFAIAKAGVFGAGYSSGGFLLNMIACGAPDLFRGIASSAAGAPYQGKEKHPNGYNKCKGQRPVAMMALHGTQDFSVARTGGAFSAAYWAYVNGCDATHGVPTGYAECYAFSNCPKAAPVAYCEIPGLSHWVWAHAQEATWSFFSTLAGPHAAP